MEVVGRKIATSNILLLGIVLLGTALRVYHLGTQSIYFDEAWSVWISKLSITQIATTAATQDVHPPVYYWILHYWMVVFGTSEFAVRLLSVLFGVLVIPTIYVLGRQLFNEEAGLLGALILAVSAFNVQYSQEARMYSLTLLLALLSMYFFIRLSRQSTLALSAAYILATTLLVYTHIYGLFVVIAQDIYLVSMFFLSRDRAYPIRRWVLLQGTVVALLVPWMFAALIQGTHQIGQQGLPTPTLSTIIFVFSRYSGTYVLLALFIGLSVLSLFAYQKVSGAMNWKAPLKALESYSWEVRLQDLAPAYFLAVWLLTINLIPFVISRLYFSIYLWRYTIAASAALYLLVAKGISNINFRFSKLAVIGIIVVLSAANLQMYYTSVTKAQAREATSFIDANLKSGDVVLVSPYWEQVTFDYYNNRTDVAVKGIQSWAVVDQPIDALAMPYANRADDKIKEIQSDVTGHGRVWLLYSNDAEHTLAKNFTLSILNDSYANVYKMSYYLFDVYLYEKRA